MSADIVNPHCLFSGTKLPSSPFLADVAGGGKWLPNCFVGVPRLLLEGLLTQCRHSPSGGALLWWDRGGGSPQGVPSGLLSAIADHWASGRKRWYSGWTEGGL
jgi:hypothetical protein